MSFVSRSGTRVFSFAGRHANLMRQFTGQPNPPLHLDSSLQTLLKDQGISLMGKVLPGKPLKELEIIAEESQLEITEKAAEIDIEYAGRKSPAARYGSQGIGTVILPNQLQNAINSIIRESDRVQLHNDAKRLFNEGNGSENEWNLNYDLNKYHSRKQASRHAERDGTAFASVALPAHYSAILSVLDHIKGRLEATWRIERVIDWGAGTGSGLCFQNPTSSEEIVPQDCQISNSTVMTYLGIDKRDGLVAIGKRLFQTIDLGSLSILWQKSFKENDRIRRSEGHDTLALSAFMLTSLPTNQMRKTLVKEMWESGAHVMVLIDHNTTAGFEAIAEAREYLLKMGRKEFEDSEADGWPIRGSHVIAPCPHDGACPLHHPGSMQPVCGFSQRIQRPSFVRKTKHSGVGHEDIGYSYVVIRRGSRPSSTATNLGRVGEVGRRALDKEALSQIPIKELKLHNEYAGIDEKVPVETASTLEPSAELDDLKSPTELTEALRLEAFGWPRLVFPPLKKNGHIILDSCTAEGKIMRLTIPKSQGKQAYYDARKSSWGDIFPHPPKNRPQERYQPSRTKRQGGTAPTKGSDIGKRDNPNEKGRTSYEALSKALKEDRKRMRRGKNERQA